MRFLREVWKVYVRMWEYLRENLDIAILFTVVTFVLILEMVELVS